MAEKYITYEALNFEGISRKPNYRIIGFSEDMFCACDRKESAALVYHVIFRWSERRRDEILVENQRRSKQGLALLTNEDVGERMWIYMSYLDFARELGGAVAYNTIISALHFLVDCKHFLERRANHDPRFGDYEYRINGAVVRKALQALPLFPPPYTRAGRGGKQRKGTETGTPGLQGTKFGTEGTETGTLDTKFGTEGYQNWGTSQSSTESPTGISTERNGDDGVSLIASPTFTFSSLLTSVATLTDEQRHQLVQALLGSSPAFPHEPGEQAYDPVIDAAAATISPVQHSSTPAAESSEGGAQNLNSSPLGLTTHPASLSPTSSQLVQESEAAAASPSSGTQVPLNKSSRLPCRVRQARKATTALTLEGQHILDLYQTFKGRKVVESDTTIKAANALGAVVGQDDDFLAVLQAIQADTFLNERGVRTDLDFVARKYDGYLDAVERQRRKAQLRSLPSTSLSPETWTIPASLPTVSGRERLVVPPDIEALMASVGGGN